MRIVFTSLCAAGAACVVDVSSYAGPSNMATTPGRSPLQPAHSEGPTKMRSKVDETTDEQRFLSADPDSITAVVAKYIYHQVEPKISTDPDSIAAVVDKYIYHQVEPKISTDPDSIAAVVDKYIYHQVEPKNSADPDSIAAVVDNDIYHQVEPKVDASALPVAMISSQDYTNVLATKSLSPFELYKALGLQELSKQEEFHPNNGGFHMKKNFLFFFNWHRLRSYTSSIAKTDKETERILHPIYLDFCNGDEGEVESLTKALDTANYLMDVSEEVKLLQNEKTPKDVFDEWDYKPSADLFFWERIHDWMRYVDIYKKVHYDRRTDAVVATGIEQSVLIAMVLKTERIARGGSPRKWMQDWIIEDWRDEGCSPAEVYTRLGFQLNVAPDYDINPFFIWMQYMDFIRKEKAAALEEILTRKLMVKSLSSGYKGPRKRTMIQDAIIHLKKEKEKMELKDLDATEVDNYLHDLKADETRGGNVRGGKRQRRERQKVNK